MLSKTIYSKCFSLANYTYLFDGSVIFRAKYLFARARSIHIGLTLIDGNFKLQELTNRQNLQFNYHFLRKLMIKSHTTLLELWMANILKFSIQRN